MTFNSIRNSANLKLFFPVLSNTKSMEKKVLGRGEGCILKFKYLMQIRKNHEILRKLSQFRSTIAS